MYCLTPSLSHVFQELLSVYLFVFGNIEFVLTMLGLCCSLEVARTSGLQAPISCWPLVDLCRILVGGSLLVPCSLPGPPVVSVFSPCFSVPVTGLLLLRKLVFTFTVGPHAGHETFNVDTTDSTPQHFNWSVLGSPGFLLWLGSHLGHKLVADDHSCSALLPVVPPSTGYPRQRESLGFTFILLLLVTRPSLPHTWTINCGTNTFYTWLLC